MPDSAGEVVLRREQGRMGELAGTGPLSEGGILVAWS